MTPTGDMPFPSANLCSSRWGGGDEVLEWLRSQDVVHNCLTSSVWNQMLLNTLWVHTAFGSTLLCCRLKANLSLLIRRKVSWQLAGQKGYDNRDVGEGGW
jgi:hypothetical protein